MLLKSYRKATITIFMISDVEEQIKLMMREAALMGQMYYRLMSVICILI